MELKNLKGQNVCVLNTYGSLWAESFKGSDYVDIDTDKPTVYEALFEFLEENSDLTKESLEFLKEDFKNDMNWAIEIEDGARETLIEIGYAEYNNSLYFTK